MGAGDGATVIHKAYQVSEEGGGYRGEDAAAVIHQAYQGWGPRKPGVK